MEGKKAFLYKWFFQKKQERLEIEVFEPISVVVFTHVSTSRVGKVVELFSLKLVIKISQMQGWPFGCVFIVFLCNNIRTTGDTKKEKLSDRNIDIKIFSDGDITFWLHPVYLILLFLFFRQPHPPSRMSYPCVNFNLG